MAKKLIPYTIYVPEEHYNLLKEHAENRKASSVIRDALGAYFDNTGLYISGYKAAINEAIEIIHRIEDVKSIAIKGVPLGDIIESNLIYLSSQRN
jgi:hypothetical protein